MKFTDLKKELTETLLFIIKKNGWKLILKEYPYMIRIKKQFDYSMVTMNIHWNGKGHITKIATHMDHPKKGKGQLYRPIKDLNDLREYLINPRRHTKVGYR